MKLAHSVVIAIVSVTLVSVSAAQTKQWHGITVASPNGAVEVRAFSAESRLQISVMLHKRPVLDASAVGLIVEGKNLGQGIVPGKVRGYRINEEYATRGVHAQGSSHCNGRDLAFRHAASGTDYRFDIRACNDGVAFRTIVPGKTGVARTPDEATVFTLPAGSTVWYHGFRGHYEGRHTKKEIAAVESGEWAAPPLTFQLPDNGGYASITEANLVNFSGLGLQALGGRMFAARLGHAQPPSYPFTLRYGEAEAQRLSRPATIDGDIVTPWRVIIIAADLNALVNSDIVTSLNPPPDPTFFPQGIATPWVKPGRAVWKYLDDSRQGTVAVFREYTDLAQALGFEYSVVEGVWARWPQEDLKELIRYSKDRGVGLFLWKHSKDLHDPAARKAFFQMCHDIGAAGVKIDFFDHEAKEVVDYYGALLKEAAEQHLLVNFHGANKPTGESRTWPNELTREAVSGMESRNAEGRPTHDVTLPFTRLLAGPADYTPVNFGPRRGETTITHQLANAVIITSPLLTYGTNPKALVESPAVDLIKSIAAVWDETIVLPPSKIGEVAAYARRSGDTWIVGVTNGVGAKSITIPLSFLGSGDYNVETVKDKSDGSDIIVEQSKATREQTLTVELLSGGGYLARFKKK